MLANTKLAFNIQQGHFKQLCPAEIFFNNDLCITFVINDKTFLLCNGFPLVVDIMNKTDKRCWVLEPSKTGTYARYPYQELPGYSMLIV